MGRGTITPAERAEFMHLPMTRHNGVPVFDAGRMREDQIRETQEALERIVGRAVHGTIRDSVVDFMAAYGRLGVRVRDVCEHLTASKPVVLKYLRELEIEGKVRIREEINPRSGGSARKRYFWTALESVMPEEDGLGEYEPANFAQEADTGIRYHGTAVQGLSCPCGACRGAVIEALEGEERSAARSRGETGLAVGLESRRLRREAEDAAWLAAARKGDPSGTRAA
jgi:hypothetical protein